MGSSRFMRIALTAAFVVAFGWGSGYLILKSIEYGKGNIGGSDVSAQRAASTEASTKRSQESPIVMDEDEIVIMIGGDVMFDRGIRAIGDRNGYDSLFDGSIIEMFDSADIAMVNLEGPITSSSSKTLVNGAVTKSFTFTFPPAAAEALAHAGIDIVSLANNHTDNFGFSGFLETKRWLARSGVAWFGNPWNSTSTRMLIPDADASDSPLSTRTVKKGIPVVFVGYHAFQSGIDRIIGEIRRVSGPGTFTIVMPHWGEEYNSMPSEKMQSQARAFIAAGADAIIGAHPHVIMDQEWVGGVPIYYSLGNLLFDQYFSPEVKHGNVVELHVQQRQDGSVYLDRMVTHDIYIKSGQGVSTAN